MVVAIPLPCANAKTSGMTKGSPCSKTGSIDISRRPSPWHEIAHSLSTTSLPPQGTTTPLSFKDGAEKSGERRSDEDSAGRACGETSGKKGGIDIAIAVENDRSNRLKSCSHSSSSSLTSPTCSGSPSSSPSLLPSPPPSTSQALREWEARLSHPQPTVTRHRLDSSHMYRHGRHKLAAESDKIGFIEYKLKLIDPTNERFERLVTQLMWRLKQGKNEAIYELGLADDGTVVGLSRAEMDASLRTLELMASEVGATVIVLREIVLHTPRSAIAALPPSRRPTGPTISRRRLRKLPSSHLSSSSDIDLPPITGASDQNGQYHMTLERQQKLSKNKARRRSKKKPNSSADGPVIYGGTVPKKMIFDPHDLQANSENSFSDDLSAHEESAEPGGRTGRKECPNESAFSFGDVDEDKDRTLRNECPASDAYQIKSVDGNAIGAEGSLNRKEEKKRRKSVARQEQRRLDLLRGDGTNPFWTEFDAETRPYEELGLVPKEHTGPGVTQGNGTLLMPETTSSENQHAGISQSHHAKSPQPPSRPSYETPLSAISPHQPARPSSLRLATPTELPDDWFVDDLLHIPLDSLSLSFADVQTIPTGEGDVPLENSVTATAPATNGVSDEPDPAGITNNTAPSHQQEGTRISDITEEEWQELICVEALVVRKSQYEGTGAEAGFNDDGDGRTIRDRYGSEDVVREEEEEWSYGGEEDVWGFGGEED
ncbi:hypothetical protein IAU59_002968 [Kwoniella sp. CBS 9459]